MTMKERHDNEESARQAVYNSLDEAQVTPHERKFLEKIHKELCKLALYYESQGFEVWKH